MADNKMTREDALERFRKAKERKRECLKKLEEEMKAAYEQRTGCKAEYFSAI